MVFEQFVYVGDWQKFLLITNIHHEIFYPQVRRLRLDVLLAFLVQTAQTSNQHHGVQDWLLGDTEQKTQVGSCDGLQLLSDH
jgi:hypothetical protein